MILLAGDLRTPLLDLAIDDGKFTIEAVDLGQVDCALFFGQFPMLLRKCSKRGLPLLNQACSRSPWSVKLACRTNICLTFGF